MSNFQRDGYALIESLLSVQACAALAAQVRPPRLGAGTRCLLAQPWCAELARQLRGDARLAPFLAPGYVAVQCTYFEKSPEQNWLVPVHQDLSIPVAARVDSALLRGWSTKEGDWFVQPPVDVLERLVAVRVHLDPCGVDDGPLKVVAGSHALGIIASSAVPGTRDAAGETVCCAQTGDALLLRPLLLHASSKSSGDSRRRVLHFLFAPCNLPFGLDWKTMV